MASAMNPRANTIGFTVPINMAKQILPQRRAEGHVTGGWLGVVIQSVTPELASEFGLEKAGGALISRVLPDGPASKADLQAGDVIVEFNGEPIEEWNELPRVVAGTSVAARRKNSAAYFMSGKFFFVQNDSTVSCINKTFRTRCTGKTSSNYYCI